MNIDIFHYMNFREFLRDAYLSKKASSSKYSYKYFAQRAGLRSASHFKMILDGDRNLTPTTARAFAKAYGLKAQQTKYFLTLVAMNQAKTTEEQAHHYEELSRMPGYRATRELEAHQYKYYARWYHVPIRELVGRGDFREDPKWIAHQLRPAITPDDARDALDTLLALGLVERDRSGKIVQSDALVTTGPDIRFLTMRTFHREMLHMAVNALDTIPLEERGFRSVTLRLTEGQVQTMRARLAEVTGEVLQREGAEAGPQAVYHFAVQLFPLSHMGEKEAS